MGSSKKCVSCLCVILVSSVVVGVEVSEGTSLRLLPLPYSRFPLQGHQLALGQPKSHDESHGFHPESTAVMEGWGWSGQTMNHQEDAEEEDGEGWGHHKHMEKEKTDGSDFFNSIIAIKYLKLGKYLILAKLLLLVFFLGGVAMTGLTVSPLALPLLAFPIALAALLVFIPVFFLAFIVVAFKSSLLAGRRRRKLAKHHGSRRELSQLSDENMGWILAAVDGSLD